MCYPVHLSHVDLINIFIDLLIHHKRPVVCHHLPGLPYRPFRLYLGIEFPIVGVQKPGPSYSPGTWYLVPDSPAYLRISAYTRCPRLFRALHS